jgi:NitT/TauT family transport system substrate-binding protein
MKLTKALGLLALAGAMIIGATGAGRSQEATAVRFAKQFGIGYLPLVILEDRKLVEKHAAAAGLSGTKVEFIQLSSGAPINDALISGQIDFASGGVGPLVTIWAKTKGTLNVKGVAALNSMPLYLNTVNPNVKTLKDFTEKDRIALPSIKVSIQAVTLQMAAEKEFGEGHHDKLDSLTVSMSHPDGMASMMSGSEVTAHFTAAPFMYQELASDKVKRILSSYDILGGPSTFNLVWCKQEFRDKNPKTYAAVVAGLKEAMQFIKEKPDQAAEIWAKAENSKLNPDLIKKIVKDPENDFTVAPKNVMSYVNFMYKIKSIKEKPADWKELFFPELHDQQGS